MRPAGEFCIPCAIVAGVVGAFVGAFAIVALTAWILFDWGIW